MGKVLEHFSLAVPQNGRKNSPQIVLKILVIFTCCTGGCCPKTPAESMRIGEKDISGHLAKHAQ